MNLPHTEPKMGLATYSAQKKLTARPLLIDQRLVYTVFLATQLLSIKIFSNPAIFNQ